MGLFEDCKEHFDTDNLYSLLLISEKATPAELKKAYKKRSLVIHPDRVGESEKEEATKKFQVLSKVYFILSDEEKRKVYDETGEIDEENALSEDKNWTDYWQMVFPKLTVKSIDTFMAKYKDSEEEREDLKKCYIDCSGEMDKMCNYIIGYEYPEEERYRAILMDLIEAEEIPNFATFSKESKIKKNARKRKFEREAKEAEALKKELKVDDTSLVSAIAKNMSSRKSQFDDMISQLEKKYAEKPKPRRSKK